MNIAVLIPCYNEEQTIEKVVKDFKKELPEADIYVYDNNSKDNTYEIAKKAGAIVRKETKQGKGNVVKTMFKEVEADIYIMVDGDDTYYAKDIHKLMKPVLEGKADMVVGDRLTSGKYKKENKKALHEFGNKLVPTTINTIFKAQIKDVMSGYRVFSKSFVKGIEVKSENFEIETEMTIYALQNNIKVEEIPIEYQDRPEGSHSKVKAIKDGSKIMATILKMSAKKQVQNMWKVIRKYAAIFMILILVYNILLFAASSFKTDNIKENIQESSKILTKESNIKFINMTNRMVFLDNYTDALMINNCYSIDSENPLESYMLARKNYVPGVTQTVYTDISGELASTDERYKILDQTGELKDVLEGKVTKSFEYGRYWHGYLVIIRPLLLLFNIQGIRIILNTIIIGLSFVMVYLIAKKINIYYAIIFGIGLISADYFVMGYSLQACFVFIIAFASSIIVLAKRKVNMPMLLFITGSVTNFIDFLTTPLITYALPVILYFLIEQKEKEITVKQTMLIIIKTAIAWCLGYGLTWIAKWLIVDAIYQKGVIATALEQVAYRSTGNSYPYIGTIRNLMLMYNWEIGLITIAIPAIITCTKVNIYGVEKIDVKKALPFIILAITPFVWYFVLKNHSAYHTHFTCRTLLPLWLGAGFAIDKLIVAKQGKK